MLYLATILGLVGHTVSILKTSRFSFNEDCPRSVEAGKFESGPLLDCSRVCAMRRQCSNFWLKAGQCKINIKERCYYKKLENQNQVGGYSRCLSLQGAGRLGCGRPSSRVICLQFHTTKVDGKYISYFRIPSTSTYGYLEVNNRTDKNGLDLILARRNEKQTPSSWENASQKMLYFSPSPIDGRSSARFMLKNYDEYSVKPFFLRGIIGECQHNNPGMKSLWFNYSQAASVDANPPDQDFLIRQGEDGTSVVYIRDSEP